MFEKVFKNIDDYIWNDAGCDNELDYAEQSSWMLFLKWFDDFEKDKEKIKKIDGKKYKYIIDKKFKWSEWAVKKNDDGSIDDSNNLTGQDLIDFINKKLFPYLGNLKNETENINTIEYKIGIIFSKLKNKIEDGYILRDIIDEVDTLQFRSDKQKHELSTLYETKIQNMGNAGRTGGQYYTPRPLIKKIVDLIKPKIGETIYDGACGSCGFLVEAYNFILNSKILTTVELDVLQKNTLFGKEKINLAFIIGLMNMILHGIESPNLIRTNTLSENIMDFQQKDKVDVVLANPPFGSGEKQQVQQNFPIKSSETAYLFLQHFIKKLNNNGRAAIIIKNTFLTNKDARLIRKELFETCNVHTILNLPQKVFTAGVKTVVLFLDKGSRTKKIFYYDLILERNLGITNPLTEKDLEDFEKKYYQPKDSRNSWFVNIKDLDQKLLTLPTSNPNLKFNSDKVTPNEILTKIKDLDDSTENNLTEIRKILKDEI
jgi:type I restriction enzyme M protein